MEKVTAKFLRISGICAIIAPILLLLVDTFHITTGQDFIWTIGMWLAFALFVPAVIGVAFELASTGSRLAYVGGALAFFGAMAGASMQVLFRTHAVLAEQGLENVNQQLRDTFKLVASTQMIGLTWPLGLLTLSIAMFLTDRNKWAISLALAAGAIAFPIGRIAFIQPAVILSGVFFVVAFGLLGKQMLTRPAM
ncbi:MAG TPA: hypothetical protein VMZ26_12115 [Pyrinomonadaceae bacterium]|nr:hypothetical protein [Pyrinomonadaceae bacterium]